MTPVYDVVLTGPATGTNQVKARTRLASLTSSLNESAATLELQMKNLEMDHAMDDISFSVNGTVVFRGKVKRQVNHPRTQSYTEHTLFCVDDTDKLHRRLVNELYTNKTAKEILTSVCSKYARWVDTSAVQDFGGPIDQMRFDYEPLSGVIDKLKEVTGGYWNLDLNGVLHFFAQSDGVMPGGFYPADILHGSYQEESNAVDLVNRVWVIGAKAASAKYVEQYWTGDGQNSLFNLSFSPNYPDVWENGSPRTIEVEKNDGSPDDKDYKYDKKNKVLRRTAGPLPPGVTLRFRYRPTVQMIDFFEDAASISEYGLYEKAIRDKRITDKLAARKRGRASLQKIKAIQRFASFSTRTRWDARVGQLATIYMGQLPYNARIETVNVVFTPADIVANIDVVEVL